METKQIIIIFPHSFCVKLSLKELRDVSIVRKVLDNYDSHIIQSMHQGLDVFDKPTNEIKTAKEVSNVNSIY